MCPINEDVIYNPATIYKLYSNNDRKYIFKYLIRKLNKIHQIVSSTVF